MTGATVQIQSDWDIVVWHEEQVGASNLDSALMNALEDNLEAVSGQDTLICRRIAGVRLPEVTEEGKRLIPGRWHLPDLDRSASLIRKGNSVPNTGLKKHGKDGAIYVDGTKVAAKAEWTLSLARDTVDVT